MKQHFQNTTADYICDDIIQFHAVLVPVCSSKKLSCCSGVALLNCRSINASKLAFTHVLLFACSMFNRDFQKLWDVNPVAPLVWPLWFPIEKASFLSLQYWDNDRHGLEILSVLSSCHQTFALAICQRFLVLHSLRSFNRIKRNNYNRKCFSFKQYKRRLYCDLTRKFSWNSAVYILSQLVILLRLFSLILVRVVNEILASGGIHTTFVLTKVRH